MAMTLPILRDREAKCEKCFFWKGEKDYRNEPPQSFRGECRRSPPSRMTSTRYTSWSQSADSREYVSTEGWISTHRNDWCGEYTPVRGASLGRKLTLIWRAFVGAWWAAWRRGHG